MDSGDFWVDVVFRQRPLQRVLGRATEFVEPVAGRAARLLEAADAWVGDGVRRASSGADGGRLLEHFPSSGLNRFKQCAIHTLLHSFISACIHGCRWIFLRGVYCV